MSLENIPEHLSVREVAELLRVNPKTVYRRIWDGTINVTRIGRAIRITKTEILRLREPPGTAA